MILNTKSKLAEIQARVDLRLEQPDDGIGYLCRVCDVVMSVPDGCDPTDICGDCAQGEVEKLREHCRFCLQTIAELREDKERLDWLAERARGSTKGVTVGGICYWSITEGKQLISEGENLREAIDDAARKEKV